MRVIHWIMWNVARIWHTFLRVVLCVHDEWSPGLSTTEQTSWQAYQHQREKRKTGRSTSRVAIPVGRPRVKPAVPDEEQPPPAVPNAQPQPTDADA